MQFWSFNKNSAFTQKIALLHKQKICSFDHLIKIALLHKRKYSLGGERSWQAALAQQWGAFAEMEAQLTHHRVTGPLGGMERKDQTQILVRLATIMPKTNLIVFQIKFFWKKKIPLKKKKKKINNIPMTNE